MKDINWIDWVKFVCIFFVYWCHIGMFCSYGSPVYFPYTPFFVNAFFFVSGLLIFRKQLNEPFVCQDTKSFAKGCIQKNGMLSNAIYKIAIPSILFSTIDYVPKTIIRGNAFGFGTFFMDVFIRGTNWFTCALFVAEVLLIFLLLTRLKNVWSYFFLCLPLVVLGYFLKINGIRILGDDFLPWFYKSSLMALFFLTCGGVYSKYEAVIDKLTPKVGGVLSIVLFVIYYLISALTPVKELKVSMLEGVELSGFFWSLFAIFVIINICKLLPHVSFVKYISRHTIGFYFLSASIPYLWSVIINKFAMFGSLIFFVGVIGSFMTAFLIVYVLNRYLPFIFDLRKLWQ